MSEKQIHIVFQVLNWLFDDFSKQLNLLPIDKLILITLASHKGIKGICPSTSLLANELGITKRHVIDRLGHLSCIYINQKPLLSIIKSRGRSSQYYLNLSTGDEPQFTTTQISSGEPQFTGVVNYSSKSGEPQFTLRTNKNKKKNREARKECALLSENFFPDEKTKAFIKELAYTPDEVNVIATDFMDHFLDSHEVSDDWNQKCRQWFRREKRQPGFLNEKKSKPIEEKPPKTREHYVQEVKAMRGIYQILGKTNGIGNLKDEKTKIMG